MEGGEIEIYTDGGCSGNPGPGGWGCVISDGERETELSGGERMTTNNRMELSAAIFALKAAGGNPAWRGKKIKLVCDSEYLRLGITKWIEGWKRNGWRTSAKKPVLNRELWETLDALRGTLDVEWSWVKGHAGVRLNERCDALCKKEMAKFKE